MITTLSTVVIFKLLKLMVLLVTFGKKSNKNVVLTEEKVVEIE